jgi:hypothetical protein
MPTSPTMVSPVSTSLAKRQFRPVALPLGPDKLLLAPAPAEFRTTPANGGVAVICLMNVPLAQASPLSRSEAAAAAAASTEKRRL